jgi:hypothetical protein
MLVPVRFSVQHTEVGQNACFSRRRMLSVSLATPALFAALLFDPLSSVLNFIYMADG